MKKTLSAESAVTYLHGVGPTAEKRLAALGIRAIKDLLWHLPFRYDDYRTLHRIASLRVGEVATVTGTIDAIATRRSFRRRLTVTEALVSDDSGTLKVIWFNQPYLANTLRPGDRVMLSGKVTRRQQGIQLASPAYEKRDREETLHVGRLVPIYPTTAGLTERQLRYFISQALRLVQNLEDPMPETLCKSESLLPLTQTLSWIHFPHDEHERDRALERLKFDELLFFQLQRLFAERHTHLRPAPIIPFDKSAVQSFVHSLPFTLTSGQRRVAWDVIQDMTAQTPMYRLLEGEVGSGKTVVAAIAAANVLAAGLSVALMAPTEILARQHFLTLMDLFKHAAFPLALHTHAFHEHAFQKKPQGESDRSLTDPRFTIGTHALLEPSADLGNLGLVIVDEQHRFGVEQRRAFQQRSSEMIPHFLSLTATPIPRTLALAIAGDLRISALRVLPKGRKPIRTQYLAPTDRESAYGHAIREAKSGRQIFIVAPLIEPSDALGVASATALFAEVTSMFAGLRVGLLHGKLPSKTKDAALLAFARHELDVLVATPVVEVGIDIPNASVMIIEGAERFGLAQLHQLRGRVGRGASASTCFLLAGTETPLVKRRLHAVATTQDGFALAELDLSLRGPGDLVGTTQSGFLDFHFATLGDHGLMERARNAAEKLLTDDPTLHAFPLLKKQLRTFPAHSE